MLIGRRARDALRSPRRLLSAMTRAWSIATSGRAIETWQRLRPRGPTAAEYREFLQRIPAPANPSSRARQPQLVSWLGNSEADAPTMHELQRQADLLATGLPPASRPFVVVVDRPVVPDPTLIAELAAAMEENPRAVAAYCDHDHLDAQGRRESPVLKSRWDPFQIDSDDYCGAVVAVRCDVWNSMRRTVGCVRDVLRALADAAQHDVLHVPGVLYHFPPGTESRVLEASGPAPACSNAWIIVPTKDKLALLERCLSSLPKAIGDHPVGVVLVDNGTKESGFADLATRFGRDRVLRVVRAPGAFNFSALCNAGAARAGDGVLVFLNNDAYFTDPSHLGELLGLASVPGVGAVGPVLAYESGRIQSAGVLVGVNRIATSALAGFASTDPAVAAWCRSRRRVSAVMGACLAVESGKFADAGGFDESLAVALNDVDLCLRLDRAGHANVFTPWARVVHAEGASRGAELTHGERAVLAREESAFLARWGHVVDSVDPASHPWLSRTGNPFLFAKHPRPAAPRLGWRD